MKSHKSIALLLALVTGIVAFRVYPGINKAQTTTYARVYEDTWLQPSTEVSPESDTTIRRKNRNPQYIKESIVPAKGTKQLKVEMFSRATHFREELLVKEDSLELKNDVDESITIRDTTAVGISAAAH